MAYGMLKAAQLQAFLANLAQLQAGNAPGSEPQREYAQKLAASAENVIQAESMRKRQEEMKSKAKKKFWKDIGITFNVAGATGLPVFDPASSYQAYQSASQGGDYAGTRIGAQMEGAGAFLQGAMGGGGGGGGGMGGMKAGPWGAILSGIGAAASQQGSAIARGASPGGYAGSFQHQAPKAAEATGMSSVPVQAQPAQGPVNQPSTPPYYLARNVPPPMIARPPEQQQQPPVGVTKPAQIGEATATHNYKLPEGWMFKQ